MVACSGATCDFANGWVPSDRTDACPAGQVWSLQERTRIKTLAGHRRIKLAFGAAAAPYVPQVVPLSARILPAISPSARILSL